LNPEERKRHIEEGLCFKCHKKGHRLLQSPELKGKAPVGVPQSKNKMMVARLFYLRNGAAGYIYFSS
jgi:hypothetical protein